jgi:hypothetical protein
VRLSAATVLDEVRKGTSLRTLAEGRSMEEIVGAVRDGKAGLRYGLRALDEDALRRRPADGGWTVAQIVGHALATDEAAHAIARSLALGRQPSDPRVPYDEPGAAEISRDALLVAIDAAEARGAEARVLAAGGPTYAHRDLGPLDSRGWILFIAMHDATHLHQAAALVRGR